MSSGTEPPAASSPPPSGIKGEVLIEEPDRAERAIARRAAEARATVPDIELTAEVDMHRAASYVDDSGTVIAALARACAVALQAVPRANGSYRDGRFELYSRINVGVILATEGRYLNPTLFDCERKSIEQLAFEVGELERRAGAGELQPGDLTGATFTLWYPGAAGIASATPVIVPPQAAALAAGAIRTAPVVRDGIVVPGYAMTTTLACDHRILYGAQAAAFLTTIKTVLEETNL